VTDASPPIAIPRLTTERLLLRELRLDDFEEYARLIGDPDVTRYASGTTDRRNAWRLFTSCTGAWMLTGAGYWAIEERATGTFAGTVGAFFRETSLPLGPETPLELGWTISPLFRRRGYATEAARAALTYGMVRHDVPRAIAQMDPANIGSVKVAVAIGMSFDGEADFYGALDVRYAIARADLRRA